MFPLYLVYLLFVAVSESPIYLISYFPFGFWMVAKSLKSIFYLDSMSRKFIPHFYTVKLACTELNMCIFFLILNVNIDCGYSIEPPCITARGVAVVICIDSMCFEHTKCFSTEKYHILQLKNYSILHL